jgi:PAS domain S-box-containing protein
MTMHTLAPLNERQRARASVDARLALAEEIVGSAGVEACAQAACDWLATHTSFERVVCVIGHETDPSKMTAIAGHGVRASRLDELASQLDGESPRWLRVPMPSDEHDATAGMLVVSPPSRRIDEVEWVARLLARRLFELRRVERLSQEEERQRRDRALLERIINSVPDLILFADLEGRVILANPRAERYFASQDDESEGRRRAIALNNMLFSAGLSRNAIEGSEARRELPLVDPDDGSDRLFELISAVLTGPGGPGTVSILRNVTDLQRATQEIEENYRKLHEAETNVRAERDRLDLIIDSVADPILVTDSNGSLVLLNQPAERLFTARPGATTEELQRVRANDAHVSSHVASLFLAPHGERWSGELGLIDPESGNATPVEAISGKISSSLGEVTGVVTILHDRREALEKARLYEQLKRASDELELKVREATAELVRQNELLRRQALELEQASNLKSQFLATMSHEFRTPLNAILGYTDMLLKGVSGAPSTRQRRSLARVDSNARHLLSIINDILDIARIEAGKMPVNVEAFRVDELLAEVLAEVAPLVDQTRVKVSSRCPRGLALVRTDRSKVKQILTNLVSNALKFTPRGAVTVSAHGASRGSKLRISVVDTGIGIAKEDHEKIFDDFRQADDSPTRPYGGAGLGLAICRRLAKVLGGQVAVGSKVGRGSTFTLTLPMRRRAA